MFDLFVNKMLYAYFVAKIWRKSETRCDLPPPRYGFLTKKSRFAPFLDVSAPFLCGFAPSDARFYRAKSVKEDKRRGNEPSRAHHRPRDFQNHPNDFQNHLDDYARPYKRVLENTRTSTRGHPADHRKTRARYAMRVCQNSPGPPGAMPLVSIDAHKWHKWHKIFSPLPHEGSNGTNGTNGTFFQYSCPAISRACRRL